MNTEYHKIQSIFLRDPETKYKTFLMGQYSEPAFSYLADSQWRWTEKINGTNIRVVWQPFDNEGVVKFAGRTDAAQIPAFLSEKLTDLFPAAKLLRLFGSSPTILYGEGFGARIQKGGGNYIPDGVDFALFDVRIGEALNYQEWGTVGEIADAFGCFLVRQVGCGSLKDAIELTQQGFDSAFGTAQAEGLVCRPLVNLFDRNGARVITKVKTHDFVQDGK